MKKLLAAVFALAPVCCGLVTLAHPLQTQSPEFMKSNELNSAAVKLFNEGKYDEALPLARQALEVRESVVGPDDAQLIPLLTNLGEICKRKDLEQSKSYFRQALKISEKADGQNDIRLAAILDSLAFVEYSAQHQKTGEELFLRSLKIKQVSLKPDDPQIAETALNLAEIYRARSAYSNAASMYQRAIDIWQNSGEKDRVKLQKALEGYVLVLTALGKTDEADKVQHQLGGVSAERAVINGGILNGKALVLMTPAYPRVPEGSPRSGEVRVQVLIDENGKVLTAKALKGNLPIEFARAAEAAAKQSRFSPTFVDGKPHTVSGLIIFNFVGR